MTGVSAMARMNIAGMSDKTLADVRKFMAGVVTWGTDDGRKAASGYLAAIDDETNLRLREPI